MLKIFFPPSFSATKKTSKNRWKRKSFQRKTRTFPGFHNSRCFYNLSMYSNSWGNKFWFTRFFLWFRWILSAEWELKILQKLNQKRQVLLTSIIVMVSNVLASVNNSWIEYQRTNRRNRTSESEFVVSMAALGWKLLRLKVKKPLSWLFLPR